MLLGNVVAAEAWPRDRGAGLVSAVETSADSATRTIGAALVLSH
jgi:hypothetical protein